MDPRQPDQREEWWERLAGWLHTQMDIAEGKGDWGGTEFALLLAVAAVATLGIALPVSADDLTVDIVFVLVGLPAGFFAAWLVHRVR